MDQSLHAPLDLDEGTVVGEAHDLPPDARVERQTFADRRPGIGQNLLHAERDPLALGVVLEHDDLHAIRDVQHLRRMADASPRHVGHVQQPVDAAQVDEGAVVGDVLHRPLEDDTFLENLQRLRLELGALALEHGTPGHDHVAARAVELEDREPAALADVAIEVAAGAQIGV